MMRRGALALSAVLVSACAVPKDAGFGDVREWVAHKSGYRAHWHQGAIDEQVIRDEVRRLLAEPLTVERAVRVALIHNRHLQATLERLGVARADLLQAGLLTNPEIGVAVRIPTKGQLTPELDADFGLELVSMLTLAARRRIASAQFEQVKLEVAHAVLGTISSVRRSYVELQAAQQLAGVDAGIADAAQASYDLARSLHHAGNIGDLELAHEQASYERVRLAWLGSQSAVVEARERLTRLMGVWGADERWRVTEPLPGIPREEPPLERLETAAIDGRLDLAAAIERTRMVAQALALAEGWGWLGHAQLGASLERDVDGVSVGPAASLALPIFDQGQAKVARLRSQLRASYHEVTALAVDIRSEVRLLRERLVMQRRRAEHYRDVVIPLRERIVLLTHEHYNFMLLGALELLVKKREETEAYREYVLSVRDYWVAKSELAQALGGKLPAR